MAERCGCRWHRAVHAGYARGDDRAFTSSTRTASASWRSRISGCRRKTHYTVEDENDLIAARLHRVPRSAERDRAPAIAALRDARRHRQDPHGRQRNRHQEDLQGSRAGDRARRCWAATSRRLSDAQSGRGGREHDRFREMSPAQKSARRSARCRQTATSVGFLGDGINDAAGAQRRGRRHFGRYRRRYRQGIGRHHPAREKPAGARGGCAGRPQDLRNIIKYIKMGASSNFGNMFSVLVASVFLPFLPMLPIQLLVQNLLYDFSQTTIPCDDVDADYLKQPRKWDRAASRASWSASGRSVPSSTIVTFFSCGTCSTPIRWTKQIAVSNRVVRRRLAHPDTDRSHDPHAAHPVYSEPRSDAGYPVDRQHHGARHLSAVLTSRRAFGNGAVAACVFHLAGCNLVELLFAHAGRQNNLHPALRTYGFELNGGEVPRCGLQRCLANEGAGLHTTSRSVDKLVGLLRWPQRRRRLVGHRHGLRLSFLSSPQALRHLHVEKRVARIGLNYSFWSQCKLTGRVWPWHRPHSKGRSSRTKCD